MTISPLEYSAASHPGLMRDNNEDCFLSRPEHGLWLVADGMGGHEAGEVASAIVRDTIERETQENPTISLLDSIQHAHTARARPGAGESHRRAANKCDVHGARGWNRPSELSMVFQRHEPAHGLHQCCLAPGRCQSIQRGNISCRRRQSRGRSD